MPNHVTNVLTFKKSDLEAVEMIFPQIKDDGIDFDILIPMPDHIYRGWPGISANDEGDFGEARTSLGWARENWGTRWNAYSRDFKESEFDNESFDIWFDTAWSVPYPAITAFANKTMIPFTHRYYDEGGWTWGVEKWNVHAGKVAYRQERLKDLPEHKNQLSKSLKGWDLGEDGEAE